MRFNFESCYKKKESLLIKKSHYDGNAFEKWIKWKREVNEIKGILNKLSDKSNFEFSNENEGKKLEKRW